MMAVNPTRPRILVRMGYGPASAAAMQAAINLARAYNFDIDGVLVEDRRAAAAGALSCARVISPFGRRSWAMAEGDMTRELRAVAAALRHRMEQMAASAQIGLRFQQETAAPGEPHPFVVLGEFPENGEGDALLTILTSDARVSGIMLTGPRARASSGPVAVIIEDAASAPSLLAAARRLASVSRGSVVAIPVASDWSQVNRIEEAVQPAGDAVDFFYRDLIEDPMNVLVALRKIGAGFTVGAFGQRFVANEAILRKIVGLIHTPLLLVKVAA